LKWLCLDDCSHDVLLTESFPSVLISRFDSNNDEFTSCETGLLNHLTHLNLAVIKTWVLSIAFWHDVDVSTGMGHKDDLILKDRLVVAEG
jgi:hypothetical protein